MFLVVVIAIWIVARSSGAVSRFVRRSDIDA